MKRLLLFLVITAIITVLAIGPEKQVITVTNDNWQDYLEIVETPIIYEVNNVVDGISEKTLLCLKEEYHDYVTGGKTELTAEYSYCATDYKFYLDENGAPEKGGVYEYWDWRTETCEFEPVTSRYKELEENHCIMDLCGGAYTVERDNSEYYIGEGASNFQMNDIRGTLVLRDDIAYKYFFSKLLGAWNATMAL